MQHKDKAVAALKNKVKRLQALWKDPFELEVQRVRLLEAAQAANRKALHRSTEARSKLPF